MPHKGQHYLIEAAAIVVRQVPDVRFVILGEGELREQLEQQIKHKHLERHVFLAGFRSNALELTKSFDVFVMSSMNEGLCTALVDAMAASKPAVATTAGGIRKSWSTARPAFWCRRKDPKAMAERIVQLLKDDGAAAAHGRGGPRARAGALHRRADGRGDERGLRTRGRHTPRSGHCESRCARLKPHAFIMPTWHSEKS